MSNQSWQTAGRRLAEGEEPADDEVVVHLEDDRSSDHDHDGENEAGDELDGAKADGAEDEGDDVSGLMQNPGNAGGPVYDMLLDTFISALEEYGEEDKKVIASAMLAHLRRTYTRPVCDQHENLQALEAALVVYGDGGGRGSLCLGRQIGRNSGGEFFLFASSAWCI